MNRALRIALVMTLYLLASCSGAEHPSVLSNRYEVCLAGFAVDKNDSNSVEDVDTGDVDIAGTSYRLEASYFLRTPLHEMATRHPFVRNKGTAEGKHVVLMDVYLDKVHRLVAVRKPEHRVVFIDVYPVSKARPNFDELDRITKAIISCKK